MNETKLLKTYLILVGGFTLLYLVYEIVILLFIAFFLNLLVLFFPFWAKKVVFLWDKLGDFMGLIIPRIILYLIYFVILVPIAFIYKIFHKKRREQHLPTYSRFIHRKHTFSKKDFEKMW